MTAIATVRAKIAAAAKVEFSLPAPTIVAAVMTTAASALALVDRLTQRCERQSRSARPKSGALSSRSLQVGETRERQPAARRRNGVEGSSGTAAPTAANKRSVNPSPRWMWRML
jgi:hypothetical protein